METHKEEDAMWRRTIATKYDRDDSGCFTKGSSRSYGKSLWKKIDLGQKNF